MASGGESMKPCRGDLSVAGKAFFFFLGCFDSARGQPGSLEENKNKLRSGGYKHVSQRDIM